MCVHAYMYMSAWGAPHTPTYTPTQIHSPPSQGDPWNQYKFNNTSANQDNLILFEDLKSVEISSHMGGCMVW